MTMQATRSVKLVYRFDEGNASMGELPGICSEHGGDSASVVFCHEVGLDYVSCSPFRIPVVRLAAAQAVLSEN